MAKGVQRWSKTPGSNGTIDSNINWAEGMAPAAVNNSGRGQMASEAEWRDDISGTITTGGSSTAYTITTNQGFGTPLTAADMSGAMITFIPHATSGLNPTLAVDGLTARAINQSTGVAVPTGALILGTPYVVTYIHASTEFILQGAVGVASVNDPLTVTSTTAGAGVGPILDLYRNKAASANDIIGSIDFNGKDSGAAKQLYARIFAQIADPVAATEDANLGLQAVIAGVLTTVLESFGATVLIPGALQIGTTGTALNLTGGNTAGRNGSPAGGEIRYNTSLNGLEYWNGTAWIVLGQQPTIPTLTIDGASHTYTAPAGVVRHRVRIWGPGGGGGAVVTNPGANGSADTSFQVNATGTAWTAVKGSGGAAAAGAGGIGGTSGTDGSTGTLIKRVAGARGQDGMGSAAAAANGLGGQGGSSPFGGAGAGRNSAAGTNAAANTGSGGGGAGGGSAQNGGAGGGSGEYAEFWVTGMTTALYTAGLGGNGGAAGTNAGGNGAAGGISIEEFYS